MHKKLNWKKSPPDSRDYKFNNTWKIQKRSLLPSFIDLRNIVPEVWDQKNAGSCTAFSTCINVLYQSRKQDRELDPSKLFLYFATREYENSENSDSGCYLRDVFKILNKTGVCKESLFPYDDSKIFIKPGKDCYNDALNTLAVAYHSINNTLDELHTCLSLGKPFVFGFNVYSSFFGNWDEIMPIPNKRKESLEGGHAVTCVGIDTNKKCFIIKNSWSEEWHPKMKGHFLMPYSFITTSDCDDFWVLEGLNNGTDPTPSPNPTPNPTNDTAADLTKVFLTKKELNVLSETIIVRIGLLLGLDVDMRYTKSKNLTTVSNFLNLK